MARQRERGVARHREGVWLGKGRGVWIGIRERGRPRKSERGCG